MRHYLARHAVFVLVMAMSLAAYSGRPGVALAAEEGTIGVVGCSNTKQHVEGYMSASDLDRFWDFNGLQTSGGTLRSWAVDLTDRNAYWADFSQNVSLYGVDVVWIQLCIRSVEASSTGMTPAQQADLQAVVGEVARRTGGVPIYISPLNGFTANDCVITGPYGVTNAVQLADWADSSGLALRGPDTGPLDHSQLAKDLCHLNSIGLTAVAGQMIDFFDVGGEPPVADFTFSPLRPRAGQYVTFQDLSADDGAIVAWSWTFGNGLVQNVQNPRILYRAAGTYEVTLAVTDDDNGTTVVKKSITVGLTDRR